MADKFSEIMVQLARRNSYQSSRAFRELSFSFFKKPRGIKLDTAYSVLVLSLINY
jgi:hypothetical protein